MSAVNLKRKNLEAVSEKLVNIAVSGPAPLNVASQKRMVVPKCNLSTPETGAGGLRVKDLPMLYSETLA